MDGHLSREDHSCREGGNGRYSVTMNRSDSDRRELTTREPLVPKAELFRAAVENAVESICITDAAGVIEYVNPAFEQISGIPRDVAKGRHLQDVLTSLQNSRLRRSVWEVVVAGRSWKGRIESRFSEGGTRKQEVTISPVSDEAGNVVRLVSVMRDVTYETLLQRQLAVAQKMEALGSLAGGIAHDFNNILLAISGCCELLSDEIPDDAGTRHNLEILTDATERARRLVNQILEFSRQSDTSHEPALLGKTVQECLPLLRATIPSTIEVRTRVDAESGPVVADAGQIQQILLNLCSNAVHAIGNDGGTLDIEVDETEIGGDKASAPEGLSEGSYSRLTVRDSGHGMDADMIQRIFDPFFTTKEIGRGTGLGLSVVNGIVQSHRGSVEVESEPGKGTTFGIWFPRKYGEYSAAGSEMAAEELQDERPIGTERLLVVDDEWQNSHVTAQHLSRLGYVVTALTNGEDALETFLSGPDDFDGLILDQTMPHLTGLQLAEEAHRVRPGIAIVLTTGFSEAVTPENLARAGVSSVLMKPYSCTKLACEVRKALDSRTN